MTNSRPSLTENPWLWVALFGGVGLMGVVVIGPKFVARWSRVERMQETRERVALERAQRAAQGETAANSETARQGKTAVNDRPPAASQATTGGDPTTLPEREPYVESDFGPPTSLRYLVVLMMLVMSVGTTGLIVSRSRERRAAEAAAAEASHPPQAPPAQA